MRSVDNIVSQPVHTFMQQPPPLLMPCTWFKLNIMMSQGVRKHVYTHPPHCPLESNVLRHIDIIARHPIAGWWTQDRPSKPTPIPVVGFFRAQPRFETLKAHHRQQPPHWNSCAVFPSFPNQLFSCADIQRPGFVQHHARPYSCRSTPFSATLTHRCHPSSQIFRSSKGSLVRLLGPIQSYRVSYDRRSFSQDICACQRLGLPVHASSLPLQIPCRRTHPDYTASWSTAPQTLPAFAGTDTEYTSILPSPTIAALVLHTSMPQHTAGPR